MDIIFRNITHGYSFTLNIDPNITIEEIINIVEMKQGIIDKYYNKPKKNTQCKFRNKFSNFDILMSNLIFTYDGLILSRNKKLSDYVGTAIISKTPLVEINLIIKKHINIYELKKYITNKYDNDYKLDNVEILKQISKTQFKLFKNNYIGSINDLCDIFVSVSMHSGCICGVGLSRCIGNCLHLSPNIYHLEINQ